MKVEIGNRKFVAFLLILIVFLLISIGVLVSIVLLKSNAFSVADYSGLFIPLGTGLMLIGSFFFSANAVENISKNKTDNKNDQTA